MPVTLSVAGGVVVDGAGDVLADLGAGVEPFGQRRQRRDRLDQRLDHGHGVEGLAQRQQVARSGSADQQAVGQPFEIADAAQTFVEFGAQRFVLRQRLDRVQPRRSAA